MHAGLRAWASHAHRANERTKNRLHALCRNKRVIRILVIQTDLGAKL